MTSRLTELLWLASSAAMLAVAVWRDATVRRIPNLATFLGAATALALAVLPGGIGAGNAMLGLVCGLAVPLPFYLLGVMGAGDVKLLAAVGAFVGFPGALWVITAAFVAGGALSVAWAMRYRAVRAMMGNLRAGLLQVAAGSRTRPGGLPVSGVRVPYSLAIVIGALGYALWSGRVAWSNAI
jgi:prepilin peptidase CpaA